MMGFSYFGDAYNVLAVTELMHMICKEWLLTAEECNIAFADRLFALAA